MRSSSPALGTARGQGESGRRGPGGLRYWHVALAVVLAGVLVRLAHLDADPDYYAWLGYVTDEGRWLRNARQVALFGHFLDPDRGLHIHLAPLFHFVHVGVFKLLGVSFLTARLVTALSGAGVLVVAWLFLRRWAAPQALILVLMLLAFEIDLVAMSRIAVPEMPAMLFQLIAFVLLVAPAAGPWRVLAAGVCLALAVATKATVLGVVPIFAVLAGLLGGPSLSRRLRNVLVFMLGVAGPVVPVLLAALVQRGPLGHGGLANSLRVVRLFIEPASWYDVASAPFDSTLAPVLNVWGMAACFAFIGWMTRARDERSALASRFYVASLVWAAGYAAVMLSLAYFPDRYRLHLLVPLAVNLAAGLTLFQAVGLGGAIERLRSLRGVARAVTLGALALPTAGWLAPLVASASQLAGGGASLRVRIVAIAVTLVVTLAVLDRRLRGGGPARLFVLFPITAAFAWLACDRLGLSSLPFWPAAGAPWPWVLAVGWMALAVAWLLSRARSLPRWRRLPLVALAGAVYAVLSLVRIVPSHVTPHYTLKAAAESLERELAGFDGVVGSRRADGLFIGNALRYRPAGGSWRPDVLVMAFDVPSADLEAEYRLVTQYDVFISPRFVPPPRGSTHAAGSRLPIRVYVRRAAEPSPMRGAEPGG